MFVVLPETAGNRLYVEAEGRLTDADYQALTPRLDAAIEAHGSIRLFCDMTAFEGWTPKAAWDDMMLGIRHWNDFERLALVGDKRWEEISAKAMDKLTRGEVRCFPTAEREAARAWIEEA